jgi:hypothetical protein
VDFFCGADCWLDGVKDGESTLNVFLEPLQAGKTQQTLTMPGERPNLQVCLRRRILVLVMIEGAPLVLVAAMAVYKDVATERILVLWHVRVSGSMAAMESSRNPPRPLDLGEPT